MITLKPSTGFGKTILYSKSMTVQWLLTIANSGVTDYIIYPLMEETNNVSRTVNIWKELNNYIWNHIDTLDYEHSHTNMTCIHDETWRSLIVNTQLKDRNYNRHKFIKTNT